MGLSRCYSFLKCLLILFNIILLMAGGVACGVAGWALWDGRAGETPQGRAALCAVAVWGAALALGALAALGGAVRNSASWLAAAFALLALTGVAGGAAAWWGAAHVPQLRHALTARLHRALAMDYGRQTAATHLLDAIQQGLDCCGVDGARDWQSSWWSREQAALEAGAGAGAGEGEGAGETETEGGAQPAAAARNTLDLSVSAPAAYYWVPPSCCLPTTPTEQCSWRVRVAAASGGGAGVRAGGCGARVLRALAGWARGPLAGGAALLALHALSLLLALALCLRARPDARYKA